MLQSQISWYQAFVKDKKTTQTISLPDLNLLTIRQQIRDIKK